MKAVILLGGMMLTMAMAQAPADRPPLEIVGHKIGQDYYPMLDRPSLTTQRIAAENQDAPVPESEQIARQQQRNRSNKVASAPIAPGGESRSRGRLRSHTRVIDNAEYIQVVVRNHDARAIKAVEWDFAFPRYDAGQLLVRQDVASAVEIRPGAKKTLKYPLPAGAKKCEVVKVVSAENQPDKVATFEAVCGPGFHDPSQLSQKQETVSIKRVEYADGSTWQRP